MKPPRQMRKGSPRWRGIRNKKSIIVNCHGHNATGLCDPCLEDFRLVMVDVPRLLDDLDIAMAGEARFVEHGHRRTDPKALTGGGNPATAAHKRLSSALRDAEPWFDSRHPEQLARLLHACLDQLQHEPELANIAREVSAAAARAHHTIERPRDLWFYGPCPDCGIAIWQERISPDDLDGVIACPVKSCGYTKPLQDHIRLQLDDNRQMTVTELVGALTVSGEPVTRGQIEGWIRRDGLARETENRPAFVDGELKAQEVYTYRLGDVRDLALRAELRKTRRRIA